MSIGGPKPRAMLGALLIERGRVVPVHQLINAIWGDRPPSTSRALVRTYVSSLRGALQRYGAASSIVRTSGGYVADVPAEALDRDVFGRLADEGRRAVAEQRPHDALAHFDKALGLWNGSAFGVTDNPFFQEEADRLEELRLDVIEGRIAAAITIGRLHDLTGELAALVARHPTRERLRSRLMVVLYRVGRRADALATYRAGREVLRDELGIEPGAELDAVHLAVLRDDARLLGPVDDQRSGTGGCPPAVRVRAEPPLPAHLPAVPTDFTGRVVELAGITAALTTASPVNAVPVHLVTGPAGTGKTTLAARAAYEVALAFPDGQLYADLRGLSDAPAEPSAVLGRFLRALGADPATVPDDVEERSARFRSMIAGRRVLLVLDDARGQDQLDPLLPGSPTCAVLVTSRYRIADLPGASRTELDVLPAGTAMTLLSRIVGEERIRAEPEAARRVVAACGRLPLGIRLTGSRLVARPGWPLSVLADRLGDERRRLDELTVGRRGARSSLLRGYRSLDPVARRGLRRLGVLGLPHFPAWIVGPLSDVPETEADAVTERLVDAHLLDFVRLDEAGQPRYRVPDLTSLFARERGWDEDGPGDLRAAFARLLGVWTPLVERAAGLIPVDVDAATRRRSYRWAEVERETSALLVEKAAECGLHRPAVDLASALRAAERSRSHVPWVLILTAGIRPPLRGGGIAHDPCRQLHIDHGR